MRILHIIQRYWPARGGAEIYLGEISKRLAADGHQVTVATTDALDFELFWNPRRRRAAERETCKDGVRVLRFPVRHLPLPRLAYPGWRRMLWLLSALRPFPASMLSYLARYTPWVPGLRRWLASTDEVFDLVAGMNVCFEPLLEAGLRFARKRGIPFICYPLTHLGAGAEPGQDPLSRFYTMRHQVSVVRASDAVIAQTPAELSFYEQQGASRDRFLVAGAGVNPEEVLGGNGERFRSRHDLRGPLLASISAMAYDKGTVHLVEAVRRLWREGRQVTLVLAGVILEPFRRYLNQLPPADRERIHVLGPVTEEDKRDLLAAADVFAMPSRTESFGIVYLEAWLYKKPVIGAQTWGVSDVVEDGQDGLLVPFGDVPALAASITRLLDHPIERARLGAHGEQKVYRLHTWDRKYTLVSELYRQLASHPE